MRLFANKDLQLLTELAGTSQAVQLLSVPRSASVPLIIQFTSNGVIYEPDPVDLTVADEAARFHLVAGTAKTISTSSAAAACVIAATGHGMLTGDTGTITGNITTTPSINGDHVITRINDDSFSIPVLTTVGGTGGTVTKKAGATLGQFILQSDTLDRWEVISVADLDSVDGYLISNLSIKWIVKELTKFDGPAMATCTDFVKSGTGTSAQYTGYVNYITSGINTSLGIDPPTTSNDVEKVACMAQLEWSGPEDGKTDWINHSIRNDLFRDEDVVPLQLGIKYAKTAIVNGDDFVEVTFGTAYGTANWHFVGAPVISNLIDATPLGIIVVGLTSRSGTGFTVKLSTAVDSSNYKLEWIAALD